MTKNCSVYLHFNFYQVNLFMVFFKKKILFQLFNDDETRKEFLKKIKYFKKYLFLFSFNLIGCYAVRFINTLACDTHHTTFSTEAHWMTTTVFKLSFRSSYRALCTTFLVHRSQLFGSWCTQSVRLNINCSAQLLRLFWLAISMYVMCM